MIQQRLYEWIKHPERLDRESLYELRSLLARYPYFQTARLLYLKNLFLLHDITFGEELRRAALYIADRRVLFSLVEGERYTLKALEKQLVPEETVGVDRTLSLIDAFLSTLPEEPSASNIISLPIEAATDYTSYLMKESFVGEEVKGGEEPKMKGQDLIDSFLENSEEQPLISSVVEEEEDSLEQTREEPEEESYFTETLAKIYVKQQRYSKALEIITRLNLKYPEKNAYFADQIRFLEKLIINNKQK
jgi:hypothetical protein